MHFLQSSAWEKFQNELGRTTFRRTGEGWDYLAILETSKFGLSRLYCPYGPTVESERALETALDSLRALARSHKVTAVRVEPIGYDNVAQTLKNQKLRRIDYSSPATTWHVNVTQTKDDILANMKQGNRNIYRNYKKKDLKYNISRKHKDITHLLDLLKEMAVYNKITIHSDEYFTIQAKTLMKEKAASLHFIRHKDAVIAAALVYNDETTTYYAHAAASHEHRKLNASTALLAEIIMYSKRRGKQVCDLHGIASESASDQRWAGFTKFKKSFGGYQVDYCETYELPIRKVPYYLYSLARLVKRLTV